MVRTVVVVLVAGLGAAAAAVVFVRWPGDAGNYGSGVGAPVRVGGTLSVGLVLVENRGGDPLIIDRVQLHHADGLTLVGSAVDEGSGAVGTALGWPPTGRRLVPARRHRIAPHHEVDLVVGIRAERAGALSAEGVDLLYHRKILGVTVKLRDHVGVWMGVCARKHDANCNPPSPPD